MGAIDVLFLLLFFFFFFFFFFPATYAEEISICGSGNESVPVRFPFQLQGLQTQHFGFPGFDLTCNSHNITVLKLPYSGEFFVRQINYATQEILLYDPGDCLPRRLLNFNLSGSPFGSAFYQNYTFLSCPSSLTKSRFTSIACLSNSTNSVLATSSSGFANALSSLCKVISILEIPVSEPVQYSQGFSTTLDNDLRLTWYSPDCSNCEAEGGVCGFKTNTSKEIVCYYNDPAKGDSRNGLQVFRIICLSIAVPAITCAVGIACFACFVDRTRHVNSRRGSIAAAPEPTIVVMGLDESTIESYQKVVLGESGRLPGRNDTTCPICLAEYFSKETLRCIPECKHCFHADCIDEWLRLNGTCPVCRNTPSPALVNSESV